MPKITTRSYPNPKILSFPQVIYLQTKPVDWDTRVIDGNFEELSKIIAKSGSEFVYLPNIIEGWQVNPNFKELATFNNPNLYSLKDNVGDSVQANSTLLEQLSHQILDYYQIPLTDFVGFLYFQDQSVVLIEVDPNISIHELADFLTKQLVNTNRSSFDGEPSVSEIQDNSNSITRYEKLHGESENLADKLFPLEAHQLAYEINERFQKLKRSGFERLVIESLSQLLLPAPLQIIDTNKGISNLHVTRDFRILLSDYGNIEVELTPLPKVVFLFFLRHPEGVLFKRLFEHRQELMEIYKEISLREDNQAINRSIDELIDPTKNSINEKCSRIKEAFIKIMDDSYAKHYYLTGNRGGAKSITLERKLLVWEGEIITDSKPAKTILDIEKKKAQALDLYNKANDARKAGNRSVALKYLNDIIQDNPYYNLAYILRAVVYLEMQNYTNAINDNTRAIELNDYTPEPYYNRSLTYFIIGSFNDALNDINHYIDIKGEEDKEWKANAHKLRGDTYIKLNQQKLAIIDYQQSTDLGNEEARQVLNSLNTL